MNRAMLCYGIGDAHAEMHRLTLPAKRAYAQRHRYTLVTPEIQPTNRPPSWEKIPAMLRLLNDFDQVLFIGADVLIVDGRRDIAENMPPEAWHALAVHDIDSMPGTPRVGHVPNCDVWLVTRQFASLLRKIDHMSTYMSNHPWWEQAACMLIMGYQLEHPCTRVKPSQVWQHTFELDGRFNSHPYSKTLGAPYFRHATGYDIPTRMSMLRSWVDAGLE